MQKLQPDPFPNFLTFRVTVQGRSAVVTTSVVPASYDMTHVLRAKNVYGD